MRALSHGKLKEISSVFSGEDFPEEAAWKNQPGNCSFKDFEGPRKWHCPSITELCCVLFYTKMDPHTYIKYKKKTKKQQTRGKYYSLIYVYFCLCSGLEN